MNPYIIDTTLRDGEQAPGVAFSIDEKLEIANLLDELGVHEVEAGTPAIGSQEQEAIRLIARSGFKFKTSSWCRARVEDIQQAAQLKTDAINISLPVSDLQIKTLGQSRDWVLEQQHKLIAYARQFFSHVTIGAQDASRADKDFLREYVFYAIDAEADRIRINDTVGILDPSETQLLFKDLTWHFPKTEFEFHGHNDFGMATANAITALTSGARCISATVNGLGERAGNSVLEEVIGFVQTKNGNIGFNTSGIAQLCSVVAKAANMNLSDNKPITGSKTYSHESGVHTSAILKNMESYQVIDPKHFGSSNTAIVFGKHSGRAGLIAFLKEKELKYDDEIIDRLLNVIKTISIQTKAIIEEELLIKLHDQLVKTN